MQQQELKVHVHISFLLINLGGQYFFPFEVSEALKMKLSVCIKGQVGGFQAPNLAEEVPAEVCRALRSSEMKIFKR